MSQMDHTKPFDINEFNRRFEAEMADMTKHQSMINSNKIPEQPTYVTSYQSPWLAQQLNPPKKEPAKPKIDFSGLTGLFGNKGPRKFPSIYNYGKTTNVSEAVNKLNMKLMSELLDFNKSVVFSPYSINYVMSIAYMGLDGVTKKEFEKVHELFSGDNSSLVYDMVNFDNDIQSDELISSNAQFLEGTYEDHITSEFDDLLEECDFELQICDFKKNPEGERTKINTWVAENTQNLIQNLLQPGTVDNLTKLVLVNTLYMKMEWYHKFSSAISRSFTQIDGNSVNVELMTAKKTNSYSYYEDDNVQVVLLPYMTPNRQHGYSFGIILPRSTADRTLRNIHDYLDKVYMTSVDVTIPKFTTEHEISLVKTYQNLGMKTLFKPYECNFGKLTTLNDLYVSEIAHKAKIIVDEEGTEAAAATAIALARNFCFMPKDDPKIFRADHTFQYFIIHNQSNTVLFTGVYNGN